MKQALKRGALIVFEGCDRCGKTTQSLKLVDVLKKEGKNIELMRFPDRSTEIGKMIGSYLEKRATLDDHVIHLLFTANRWEKASRIKELLNAGTTLIVDRYSFSGVAFSASKKGMCLTWCKAPEVGLPKPDLIVYLDMPPESVAKRGRFGDEIYEKEDFQRAVGDTYSHLFDDSWKIIDGDRTVEEVHEDLKDIVIKTMDSELPKTVGALWSKQLSDS